MDERLRIDVVSTMTEADRAMAKLLAAGRRVFGVDCEWDLVREKGAVHRPDLLQVATPDNYCALFRLNLLRAVPSPVKRLLEDPLYTKVGVGVLDDTNKLEQTFGVVSKGVVDVRHLADEEGIDPRGLSQLTSSVLGIHCQKHHHSFHYWTGRLREVQKQYAALDAVYGARIFVRLNHAKICSLWGKEWTTWDQDGYHKKSMTLWNKYSNKPFDYQRSRYVKGKTVDAMLRLSDLSTNLTN